MLTIASEPRVSVHVAGRAAEQPVAALSAEAAPPEAAKPLVDSVATLSPTPSSAPSPLSARLKKAFFRQAHKDGQIHGSIFNKLTFGAVLGASAWTATNIAAGIAGTPTVGAAVGLAATAGASLFAGYMAADVVSGVLHHWADNYANPKSENPFVRKFAKQAQRHHFHPRGLGNYTPSAWASPVSLVSWAPLVAANLADAPVPVLAGTLSLVLGTTIYGVFHMWSHKRQDDVPPIGRFLQKAHVAVSPQAHNKHHGLPWNSDFCLVSGLMNKPLQAIKFWPRYEKAVYAITGKAPESWNVPQYKDYVDGRITHKEYVAQMGSIRKTFAETEYHRRKEVWGID